MDQLTELSATDWLVAGSIVLGAFLVGMVLKRLTTRVVEPHGLLLARLLGRFALAGTLAVGLVYALNRVNVAIAPLLGFLGLFGLAFALAFQEVLGNFIAGVMLSIRRPFKAGDEVSTSGYEGRVEDVNLRTTTLRLYDGVEAYIPNSMIWSNPIENFHRSRHPADDTRDRGRIRDRPRRSPSSPRRHAQLDRPDRGESGAPSLRPRVRRIVDKHRPDVLAHLRCRHPVGGPRPGCS